MEEVVWHYRCRKLPEWLRCDVKDVCTGHILVSDNAKFYAVDGYTTLESSDAFMVESHGNGRKRRDCLSLHGRFEYNFDGLCIGNIWIHSVENLIKGGPK